MAYARKKAHFHFDATVFALNVPERIRQGFD